MSEQEEQKPIQLHKGKVVKASYLDFLFYGCHERGIPLDQDKIQLLKDNGYIKENIPKPNNNKKFTRDQKDLSIKGEIEQELDKGLDIIREEDYSEGIAQTEEEYLENIDSGKYEFAGEQEINKEDWMPVSRIEHKKEFVKWIDSINDGFQNMIKYKPFQLYVKQATMWYAENKRFSDYDDPHMRMDFAHEEMGRCRDNSLYAMNKYLILKEGDMSSGARTYDAKPVHEVMCFMIDCGYSIIMGKPRQIAATSTIGGVAMFKILLNKNLFIKFITEDKETGEEIFEDKIKYPFTELPPFMTIKPGNDRDNLFKLGGKGKNGKVIYPNSKIKVVAPSVSAINGGSPNIVLVDEAGYIRILGKMLKEARPTMFWQNPVTGKMEMKRQIISWGTAGSTDKGGKAYEEEYMDCMKKWQNRQFYNGIVPLFFDWTTRPGIDQDHYDKEKTIYTVEGPEAEAKMVQFRQAYPRNIADMFLTSAKTLISIDYIDDRLSNIRGLDHDQKPVRGFFEPIYDPSTPSGENSDVPFKIIGANFIPTDDMDDRVSTLMFLEPDRNWTDRYYQGTDPISTDNGYSNMGSTIFDAHYNTVSCIVNYRDPDHKQTFLQCMLAGIYYDNERVKVGIPELLEGNIGTAYSDYKDNKGYFNSLVRNKELPIPFQGGQARIGIDNRGNRTRLIIDKMYEFFVSYGDNIYIDTPFEQLKTFNCKVNDKGNETWGTADKRKYLDDILFSSTFSYICRLAYYYKHPKELKSENQRFRTTFPVIRNKDGKLTRIAKRIAV